MSDAAVLTAQTADQVLATWLDRFNAALADQDVGAVADLFTTDCYWRDLVALTWNLKTVEGREGVRDMLTHTLRRARPGGFHATEPATEADGVVDGWLAFETGVGRGRGHVRLKDGQAWTLLTTLSELKGHEEPAGTMRPKGAEHGVNAHRQSWLERRRREASELGYSTQPEVLIIGGGQGGIALAARLRQLDVADHRRRPSRQPRRPVAGALQVAVPARPGLV